MPLDPAQVTQLGTQRISYRRSGAGTRRILFFHGFPGSSAQIGLFDSRLEPDGLDVLCLDRPGYGRSTPGASHVEQLAQGVLQCRGLLDELGWDRFEIVAASGGAPLGISVAHTLGARVIRTTIACGLGQVCDPKLERLLAPKLRAALALLPALPARIVRVLEPGSYSRSEAGTAALRARLMRLFFTASRPDQDVLAAPDVIETLLAAQAEAWQQGGLGPQADARSYRAPWGWELGEFKGRIRFFHGEDDQVIPPGMSRLMAERIPGAECTVVKGEGHFSLPLRRLPLLLSQ